MNNNKNKQAILFFLNSVLTGAIYAAILLLLDSILHVWYYYSVTAAYLSAMTYYFMTNKKVIFKTETNKRKTLNEVLKFVLLLFVNYLVSIAIIGAVYHFTKEVYSGSLLAGVVTIIATYFVFDKIIFKKR